MYTVYSNTTCLMDPSISLLLIDPVLDLAMNEAGSFSFSIPASHPAYEAIEHGMRITVSKDDEPIFYGRVNRIETDFYKTKSVEIQGELSYLADTIQRPAEYHDMSVRGFIQTLLDNHNAQSAETFELGVVNITDPNDSLYRYTNYEDTLFCLMDKVINRLGGILQIRHENDHRYLDILSSYPRVCGQQIHFRENLMDYVCNSESTELATVVIPLGATLEDRQIEALDERVSIAAVNNQKDYLEAPTAIAKYGRICKVVTFEDIHTPSLLKTKGQEWLEHNQYEDLQLEISAVDLSMLDVSVDDFRLLDRIRIQSDYHQIDEVFPLTSMTIHLLQPDQNLYHLGGKPISFTSSSRASQVSITQKVQALRTPNSLLEEAKEQATQLLTTFGKYGHVVQVQDEQGQIQEICIIDTEDLETAQNVWRWNMGGLGFSSNGYAGPYETAMTMDGTIAGNMVAANSIAAEKLDISYRTSVEQNISDSLAAAKADTSEKLKAYWTQVETESRITNAMDSISLSVYQQAKNYTDGQFQEKLAQYYSKSEIDLKTDSIQLQVYQEYALPNNLLPYTADWGSTYTWKRHANCTVSSSYVNGAKTMQFDDSISGDVEILTSQGISIPFNQNHYYTFSAYIRGTTTSPVTLEIRTGRKLLEAVKTTNSSSTVTLQADQTTGVVTTTIKPPSYDYRISITFRVGTIASSSSFGITLKKTGAPGTSNFVTFSRFKLEEGQKATDYQKQMSELTSTQASIQMNYDSIVSTVSTKVGTNQIASYIQQNAEAVRIAWSNISNYIEFSGGTINIFSASSKTAANRLMQLGQSGMTFWRDSYNLGRIGVNSFTGYSSARGLVFDLDPDGAYMAWAAKVSSSGNYIVQMLYANKSFGDYVRDHLYFSCEVDFFDNADFHYHHLKNCNLQQPDIVNSSGYSGFGSWSSPTSIKLPISINSDGTVQEWYNCKISGGVIY